MSNIVKMPSISPQSWPQQNWSGSWPPSCSCGCNPCQCGGGLGGLMQCWQDIAQFQQFLMCMLSQMGPFPMQGVTDGSNAAAGNIGEFVQIVGTMAYADVPTHTNGMISVGVVSPGDWDLWAYAQLPTFVNGFNFALKPVPTGMSNSLAGVQGALDASQMTTVENTLLVGQTGRGNFTVPTLLAFNCDVWQPTTAGAGTGPGTMTLTVGARRRR